MSLESLERALAECDGIPLEANGTTFSVSGVIIKYLESEQLSAEDRRPFDEFLQYAERVYNAEYGEHPYKVEDPLDTLPLLLCLDKLDASDSYISLLIAYCTTLAGLFQHHPDIPDLADKMFFKGYSSIIQVIDNAAAGLDHGASDDNAFMTLFARVATVLDENEFGGFNGIFDRAKELYRS